MNLEKSGSIEKTKEDFAAILANIPNLFFENLDHALQEWKRDEYEMSFDFKAKALDFLDILSMHFESFNEIYYPDIKQKSESLQSLKDTSKVSRLPELGKVQVDGIEQQTLLYKRAKLLRYLNKLKKTNAIQREKYDNMVNKSSSSLVF